jgi:hypothetical protein
MPNTISGEQINIGVIVFDNETVKVNFISHWRRVKSFVGADIQFLKDLAEEFRRASSDQLALPGIELGPKLNEALINQITSKWNNSIQVTPPRASLKPLDELLPQVSMQFLKQPVWGVRLYRDRRSAAHIAKIAIRKAFDEKAGKDATDKYYHTQHEVAGMFRPHLFDVVIANGSPKVAVQGLSFELPEATFLDQLINSTAFQIFDSKKAYSGLRVGILALPPLTKRQSRAYKIYKVARDTFTGLHAEFIEEDDVEVWAKRQAEQVSL